jgi:hypothetical protein
MVTTNTSAVNSNVKDNGRNNNTNKFMFNYFNVIPVLGPTQPPIQWSQNLRARDA